MTVRMQTENDCLLLSDLVRQTLDTCLEDWFIHFLDQLPNIADDCDDCDDTVTHVLFCWLTDHYGPSERITWNQEYEESLCVALDTAGMTFANSKYQRVIHYMCEKFGRNGKLNIEFGNDI